MQIPSVLRTEYFEKYSVFLRFIPFLKGGTREVNESFTQASLKRHSAAEDFGLETNSHIFKYCLNSF